MFWVDIMKAHKEIVMEINFPLRPINIYHYYENGICKLLISDRYEPYWSKDLKIKFRDINNEDDFKTILIDFEEIKKHIKNINRKYILLFKDKNLLKLYGPEKSRYYNANGNWNIKSYLTEKQKNDYDTINSLRIEEINKYINPINNYLKDLGRFIDTNGSLHYPKSMHYPHGKIVTLKNLDKAQSLLFTENGQNIYTCSNDDFKTFSHYNPGSIEALCCHSIRNFDDLEKYRLNLQNIYNEDLLNQKIINNQKMKNVEQNEGLTR